MGVMLEPAADLSPHLRLVRPLHEGNRSSLWLGRHYDRDEVVVKLLNPELIGDGEALERFKRGADVSGRINSHHIARVHERGVTDDGIPYLVMERLAGETLAQRLMRRRLLEPALVAEMVHQAADGIDAAHVAGISHRDIEPSNIFMARTETGLHVKILDFGVAKITDEALATRKLTRPGQLLGAPPYLSPERLKARSDGSHGDIWSLAIVAYQALTRELPFTGDTLGAMFVAIISGKYDPPSVKRQGLPPLCDEVFATAFSARPDDRFQTAGAFATALSNALNASAGARQRVSTELRTTAEAAPPERRRADPAPSWRRTPDRRELVTHVIALVLGIALALLWTHRTAGSPRPCPEVLGG